MFRLDGKVALVTGAGSGLGTGVVQAFARQGAHVVVNDYDAAKAEATAAAIRADGFAASALPFDVTDPDAAADSIAAAQAQAGPIDILVNNAGNAGSGRFDQKPFAQTVPEEWRPFIGVNLMGVLHCTRAVIQGMCDRRWGRVITVSSTAGIIGASINVSVYGAAKAGAAHFMRHLSQEVAPFGVTANVIALGFMNTVSGGFADKIVKTIPTGRMGTPDDLGAAAVYLASEEASWVTGSTLRVDGGSVPV